MATVGTEQDGMGMMDIGKHCTICRQIDFLPFTCPDCLHSYCNNHRDDYNKHDCILKNQEKLRYKVQKDKVNTDHLPSAKSVFPNLDKIRKDANEAHLEHKKKSIGQRLTNDRSVDGKQLTTVEVALLRLKKFMSKGKQTSNSSSKLSSSMGLLGSLTSGRQNSSKALQMANMARLRKLAKGDGKIPLNDRIYIWVAYIPDDESAAIKYDDKMNNGFFVSKRWPVGKMLDYLADQLKVQNLNNRQIDKSMKLTIFRSFRIGESNDEVLSFKHIPYSGRVEREVQNGETVYLVRGYER
ncbi:Cuz1 protein [Martiniozyma asiatica (nom. inval.)]|nr:Cuz1 protein [Martiniozyma asiatica]